jgi:hypothetical protein
MTKDARMKPIKRLRNPIKRLFVNPIKRPKINNCGFEKITTNDDKIVLAVDPKFTEQEMAADRTKILMNLKSCFDESAAEFQH